MPKLTIDDIGIEVAAGTSVLQACEELGIEIPRFCYHDKLSVPGNCRMCLVEQEKAPKPVPSCTTPCADGMVIRTNTPAIKKARQGVMEMLLLNHPLDCPICDQGGECDLQDQAMAYGYDRGRTQEPRRVVTDKELGPLIKTVMTRCIHCTRCVRFLDEIAGTPELGLTGRGNDVEITTYIERALTSELSGNLVDVCPVGALTNKPYAFRARPWELRKTESVDVFDAVGSNIRIDARGNEVLRVLPRLNEEINEVWLADKSRYAIDGLKRQRLDRPYVRNEAGKLVEASWDEALEAAATAIKRTPADRVAALAGDLADVESMYLLKMLMRKLRSPHTDCRQDGANFDTRYRAAWLFNTTLAGIEQADAILLIGTNPRKEAPLVNARIRKRWRQGNIPIAMIGGNGRCALTYDYTFLGDSPAAMGDLGLFGDILRQAKRPMLILGAGTLSRPDGAALHALACRLAEEYGLIRPEENWNGFNVLHLAAARVGGLETGFVPEDGGLTTQGILQAAQRGEVDVIINLGADELDMTPLSGAFHVYIGHHGDRGAHAADVILPAAAYTEKDALYVNTEGRAQKARRAVPPPGQAREDWQIIRALAEKLGKGMTLEHCATLADVREALASVSPVFAPANIGRIVSAPWQSIEQVGVCTQESLHSPVGNYYMTDPISRASATMARCVEEIWPLTQAQCGCGGACRGDRHNHSHNHSHNHHQGERR